MEETRGAAMAYYANMSDDLKDDVVSVFKGLDKNGDGKVSLQEFSTEAEGDGFSKGRAKRLFKLLDQNNDGTLDFEECVTLVYIGMCQREVYCDGCACFLLGVHFLCVECYNADGNTFDLCTSCYRQKEYNHAHAHFMDNYALLRMRPRKVKSGSAALITKAALLITKAPTLTPGPVSREREREMEEMRGTAMARFSNMPADEISGLMRSFLAIDKNGDGKVSIQEYEAFHGPSRPNLFQMVDKNNEGTLDFVEYVTLSYMVHCKRFVYCDGCLCNIWGLYFLCVECNKANGNDYELCTSCYGNKKYNHAHAHFMDNYALLRMKPWKDDTSEPVDTRKQKVSYTEKKEKKATTSKKDDKGVSERLANAQAINRTQDRLDILSVKYDVGQLVNSPDFGEAVSTARELADAGEGLAAFAEILAAAASCTIM